MTIKAKNRVVIRRAPTNGANGKPGMAMVLNPANIVLDTETDGLVHNFSKATCTVQLMQGTLLFAPAVSILQQVRCSAQVSGSVIRITAISVDPITQYSYGSAYVDFSASANGQTFKGRLSVQVNVLSVVARIETANHELEQNVTTLMQAEDLRQETMTKLAVQQQRIVAQITQNTQHRYNMLPSSKTLVSPCTLGSGVTLHHRMEADFTVASATASDDYVDVLEWQGVEFEPNTYYSLSFWAKGQGQARAFLYPEACANSTNSQGFESENSDGHSQFQLANEWQWYWVVFKTSTTIEGLKRLLPFRLMPGANGMVFGVCLVQGAMPVHWLPYNYNPQRNWFTPTMAADASPGEVIDSEVVEDSQMGTVMQLTSDLGRNFQLVFDAPDYQQLNNQSVTMFVVIRQISPNPLWHFGGWNNDDEYKGSFAFLNNKAHCIDLGNGWKKYYTSFYNVNNRLWNGVSALGLNSLKGTVQVHSAGLVLGEQCPEWHTVPLRRAMKRAGLDIDTERIELNGRTMFKNDNATVPLFAENGKLNPQLSTAQYLMNVLRSMETMIDGGLVIAGLMAAKDGNQVTAYLNGLRQKMHALAAGVRNFGTNEETALSYINFDGSAKFGNLGIAADGSVNIIDHEGKPRINITPEVLPTDSELFKNADVERKITLGGSTVNVDPVSNPHAYTDSFEVMNNNSFVHYAIPVRIDGYSTKELAKKTQETWSKGLGWSVAFVNADNGNVISLETREGNSFITARTEIYGGIVKYRRDDGLFYTWNDTAVSGKTILSKGRWKIRISVSPGVNVNTGAVVFKGTKITINYVSGMQSLNLAHNGFASIQSGKQAVYVRDGKLHAFGSMNIPGILLAGTINRNGGISNAWGEFVQGASLQYVQSDGRRVARVVFKDELPCGANYVAIANVNGDSTGCTAVVWRKTAKYCDFRVVEINGGEPTHVGLDVVIIGRNHA